VYQQLSGGHEARGEGVPWDEQLSVKYNLLGDQIKDSQRQLI
jgi:hypothetical protein